MSIDNVAPRVPLGKSQNYTQTPLDMIRFSKSPSGYIHDESLLKIRPCDIWLDSALCTRAYIEHDYIKKRHKNPKTKLKTSQELGGPVLLFYKTKRALLVDLGQNTGGYDSNTIIDRLHDLKYFGCVEDVTHDNGKDIRIKVKRHCVERLRRNFVTVPVSFKTLARDNAQSAFIVALKGMAFKDKRAFNATFSQLAINMDYAHKERMRHVRTAVEIANRVSPLKLQAEWQNGVLRLVKQR